MRIRTGSGPAGNGQDSPPPGRAAGRQKGEGGKAGGKAGDDGLEFMREMAGGPGAGLAVPLPAGLRLPFSGAPNAVYGLPDTCRLLPSACSREGGGSGAEAQYQRGRALEGAKRLPSHGRVPDVIRGVRRDRMPEWCRDMVARPVVRARRHGMLRRPTGVAMERHDIPSCAGVLGMAYAAFPGYGRGTKKFHRLATPRCVAEGHRPAPGAGAVRREDDAAGTVRRLLRGGPPARNPHVVGHRRPRVPFGGRH